MKPFSNVAVAIFTLVALVQLFRVLLGFDIVINGFLIPPWVSLAICAFAATMAVMLSREARG